MLMAALCQLRHVLGTDRHLHVKVSSAQPQPCGLVHMPNTKEKCLLQASSLESHRHLLPEAPSRVLSMGRKLGAKVGGEEARQTSIGSHVSTELCHCLLPCTITDCSGGSWTERRIFKQAQDQEK